MHKIALFGATGQIGRAILSALLNSGFHVVQVISPGSESRARPESTTLSTNVVDLASVSRNDLASVLAGTEAVISALNGKALEAQGLIQDAAWDAGVKRFYPSEYGMHHIYRRPGDTFGFVHPVHLLSLHFLVFKNQAVLIEKGMEHKVPMQRKSSPPPFHR